MTVDRVESLRAYRATLQRRFDQASHAALEKVPGGEWDGIQVLRRAELEQVIHDLAETEVEQAPSVAEVMTPGRVFTDAICPRCDIPTRILVLVSTELVVSDDGAKIQVKAKAKASAHTCGQLPLEPGEEEDPDSQMRLTDLIGPTEAVLVSRHDFPRPDDATLDRPADERCSAEAVLPSDDPEVDEDDVTCERLIDHETEAPGEDAGWHWAEGGFAWRYEQRPVPAGLTNEVSIVEDEEEASDE